MTADQLRKSILQQAIQGKLVPQDPSDEPASVLLEKIRKEKACLVKEKKIKKTKNESIIFRGDDNRHYEKFEDGTVKCIEEEIPFEVPKSWVWCRLGNVMRKVAAGSTPHGGRNVYVNDGVKFIRSQNVYNEGLIFSNIAYITSEIHKNKSNSHVKANDLLLNITGASIGRCALVPKDFDTANINQHVLILRLIDFSIKDFCHLAVTSPLVFEQIMGLQVGGTKEGLSAEKANKLLMPIPPMSEQYRIIERIKFLNFHLNKYSDLEFKSRQLDDELYGLLKKSILQHAIQGKLVPQNPNDEPASKLLERIREEKKRLIEEKKIKPNKHESFIFKGDENKYYERIDKNVVCIDEEIPFEIPSNWEFVRLNTVCWLSDGKKITGELLPYLEAKYLRRKALPQLLNSGKLVIPPCKVILVDGENSGEIFNISEKGYLGSTFKVLGMVTYMDSEYVNILLDNYKNLFRDSKIGAAIPHLNKTLFKNLIIGIPPINEQKRIVKTVKVLISKIQ